MSSTASAPRVGGERRNSVMSNVARGSLGNLIEWFDFYNYAIFTTYIASNFFAKGDETQALLDTWAVFAITFLMRPIGSWFFGRYADRKGRRAALTTSVLLMALGTLMIGAAPTYDRIGIWATVLLWVGRAISGFSVGGEYGTTAAYMSEIATPNRRGFYSSFQYVTLVGGQVLAALLQVVLQHVLDKEQMHTWGWRLPFFIGAAGALVVLWLRRSMDETADVADTTSGGAAAGTSTENKGSLGLLFREYWRPFIVVVGLTIGGTTSFYVYTTLMQSYMKKVAGLDADTVSIVNLCALTVFMIVQPLYGLLSDRIGRRTMLLIFGVGSLIITWPVLGAIRSVESGLAAFGLQMFALLIVAFYTSVNAVAKAELFPTRVRALGVGLGYGLANAVFGGTAPYIGTWFASHGNEKGFRVYLLACVAVSLAVYLWGLRNKTVTELDRDFGSAWGDAPDAPSSDDARPVGR
ncbi:MFS transporter [Dermacoccus nishinomiyaensis]|uniref:MFS transporter n=1 Tax=Dermacoccus nishinomiyaensis TaxID=1274 RepID=UPI0028AFD6D2|nr:MFS transporter [Dermacoccus nishinomiyaensis]